MNQKLKDKLQNMVRCYSYYYYDVDSILSVPIFDHFVDYIENFDFRQSRKETARTWSFHWFNYLDPDIESLWDDLSLESKTIAFVDACRLASNDEVSSEESDGEDW